MRLLFLLFALSAGVLRADGNATEMLARACRTGDLKMAEALLSSGMDPDQVDYYRKTPLYYASSFNETKIVGLLLAHHANPNSGSLPLQAAAELGNLRIAEMLLTAGAHVNAKTHKGRTALHVAVTAGHLDLIRLLIEKGAEVNARDVEGTSPLDDAVWRGHLDATAILLAHGARLNEPETRTGATPINEAAYLGNANLIRYLLQFNPDLGIPDKNGFTPLENAIRMRKADSAVALLRAEVKEHKTPQFFEKTLGAAINKDEAVVVSALLRDGAPANGVLSSGATPLDAAACARAPNVVRALLNSGADPNRSGSNGTTPLEDAALRGLDSIAAMLLDHGAQVNQVNIGSGTTALYAAAAFGKGNIVTLLLERAADPNLCGKNQKTPYQAALENGYREIAAEIQQHGGSKACRPQ